jgi:hypothetical protein
MRRTISASVLALLFCGANQAQAFDIYELYYEFELFGLSAAQSHDEGSTKRDFFMAGSVGVGHEVSRTFRYGIDLGYYSNSYPQDYSYLVEYEQTVRTTLKAEKGWPLNEKMTLWGGAGLVAELSSFSDRYTSTDDGYLDELYDDTGWGYDDTKLQLNSALMFKRTPISSSLGVTLKAEVGLEEDSSAFSVGLRALY